MSVTWNPELYTKKHSFVYEYGESLVDLLDPQPGEYILDAGCGTGELTHQISEAGATVVGIDSSEVLIATARQQFPSLSFHHQDATQLTDTDRYDAVFSNAVLHWIKDQEKVTQRLYQALKPGGRLVVELGGKGNVQQIREALKEVLQQRGYSQAAQTNLWYFPSVGEYTTLLEQHGFHVQTAHHYERPTPLADVDNGLRDWLVMFASGYLETIPSDEHEAIIDNVATACKQSLRSLYRDGQWYADYQRLRVTATKPTL